MLVEDPSRFEWIATAAKYLGLAFTAGLGLVGTVTDTKEKTESGDYKVRRVGWFVVSAIIVSTVVGGVGQWFDDRAKVAAAKAQKEQGEATEALAERSLMHLSSRFTATIRATIPLDQPALRDAAALITARGGERFALDLAPEYEEALRNVGFSVVFEERTQTPRRTLAAFEMKPPVKASVASYYVPKREITLMYEQVVKLETSGIYSLKDFGDRRVEVNAGNSSFTPIGSPALVVVPLKVTLTDNGLDKTLVLDRFKWLKDGVGYGTQSAYETITAPDVSLGSPNGWQ